MADDIGARFRALHRPGEPFILANAWDIGSARLLAGLGAAAIGTTSSGHAFTIGRPDMGHVGRDESLAHAAELVAATPLPVSGDFENGYGAAPETVAETIRLAAEVGLAGCSIEDTDVPGTTPYARELAVDRIRAAVAAARALPGDFVLVARADGVLNRTYDLEEAIWRIKAFADAGADCVYVPTPGDAVALSEVVAATKAPVNALAVGPLAKLSLNDFAALGVARISLGSALARIAQRALHDAAEAMLTEGAFDRGEGISGRRIDALLAAGARPAE